VRRETLLRYIGWREREERGWKGERGEREK
jgi:hypothetical protein